MICAQNHALYGRVFVSFILMLEEKNKTIIRTVCVKIAVKYDYKLYE